MKVLNDNNFNEFISNENISVVDFYADWCGPCKMLSPILEELSSELKSVNFGKLNVDDSNIPKEYGIMSIPTIIVFKNNEVLRKNTGFMSKDDLKSFILGE